MEQQAFQLLKRQEPYPVPTNMGQICEQRFSEGLKRRPSYTHDDLVGSRGVEARSRLHEVFFVGVIVCAILTWVSLFQVNQADAHGWGFFLKSGFGGISYLIPIYLLYIGVIFYKHFKSDDDSFEMTTLRLLGVSTLYLSLDAIFGSGNLGQAINQSFFDTRYAVESWIVVLGLFFASLFLITNFSFIEIGRVIRDGFSKSVFRRRGGFYPIDGQHQQTHYNEHNREPNLITYQQPFSQPHIHDPQSNQLISCLAHFGIRAVVSAKIPGPVITRFELHLAPGTKSSSICAHHKEIARSLCVQEVRVIEVIAGKSCIGIEVPNSNREIFSFDELKDELEFSKEKLPLLLGRTITGECKIVDLHTMPHLLIAGSTRSGKTMLLQSILMSLTQKHTATDLKICLIDVKQIAFTAWKNTPHLLHPVITDSNEAVNALQWCVNEMERRYSCIANNTQSKFPTLIVLCDEFADLITSHKNEIEEAVKRLAQKARQCDIHLILSTQRPTADVITGHIKSNMPTRIALSVPERRDSRIILEEQGAYSLCLMQIVRMHIFIVYGQPYRFVKK